MTFFLDFDVPVDLARMLKLKGHEVQILEDVLPRTADDLTVLRHARSEQRVLLTCNRQDFLQLAQTEPHVGIIIIIRRRSRIAECAALLRLLNRAGESGLRNNINFA